MNPILLVALAVAVFAAAIFALRSASAQQALNAAGGRAQELEKRLAEAQESLNGAREDLRKKSAALEEARDRAQKAKVKADRKERAQEKALAAPAPAEVDPLQVQRYVAAVEAAERRAAAAEKDAETRAEAARAEARKELEGELADLRRRLQKSEERLTQKETEKVVKKEEERVEVPGARLDLKTLPPPVVEELGRFYKRAINAEKFSVVTEKQLELAQDKVEELQRRYFAVCRELALVAVNKDKPQEISDAEAAKLAMDMVAASEEASRRRAQRAGTPAPRRERGDRPERSERRADGDEGRGPRRERRRPRRDMPQRPERGDATETAAEGQKPVEKTEAVEQKPAEPKAADAPAEPKSEAAPAKDEGQPAPNQG